MNDIVITYDKQINSENRLKLLIRSIENNCEGFNEIVIVGDKPDWIQGVVHIGFSGVEDKNYLMKNQYRKLKAACISGKVTDSFYWVDADDYLIWFDARKATRISLKESHPDYYKPKGKEVIVKTHTDKLMVRRGFGTSQSYFNKFPMSMSRDRLMNTFNDIDFETKFGYCIKTLYANFNRFKPTQRIINILDLQKNKTKSSYERN